MEDSKIKNKKSASAGVIFATTGPKYNILARRAARTLRLCMPDMEIDWFTDDASQKDPVFDIIHTLSDSFFRPKMEALRRSRFDKTLFLDADILVITDVSELFVALDNFDLLGAHAEKGIIGEAPRGEPPRCLLPINSGVLAIRKSNMMDDFLLNWETEVRDKSETRDQPALRRTLMQSKIRFSVLGAEYNMMKHSNLENWGRRLGAPRIIHSPQLHKAEPGDPKTPYKLDEALSPDLSRYVKKLIEIERSREDNLGVVILTPRQKMKRKMDKQVHEIHRLKAENNKLILENGSLRSKIDNSAKVKVIRMLGGARRKLRKAVRFV